MVFQERQCRSKLLNSVRALSGPYGPYRHRERTFFVSEAISYPVMEMASSACRPPRHDEDVFFCLSPALPAGEVPRRSRGGVEVL